MRGVTGTLAAAVALHALAAGRQTAAAAPPFAPRAEVRRLGTSLGHLSAGGITREIVSRAAPRSLRIDISDVPDGTLHLAAAVVPKEAIPGARRRCVARIDAPASAGVAPAVSFDLDGSRPVWIEGALSVRARPAAVVLLECDEAATPPVAWARPIVVPATGGAAPLVILVSLDTLRADHVSGFGAPSGRTPTLERLGREGVRFVATTAEGTWTLPSHFALFYSRLYGFPLGDGPTIGLARALAERGFATVALTGGGFVGAMFNFHQGFDHYAEYHARDHGGSDVKALSGLLAEARRWIDRHAEAPLFLFLHTYAVHEITRAEAEWQERHQHRLVVEFAPSVVDVERARTQYARLVRETDAALEPFLDGLRALAVRRPLLLAIVSDHGEAFGEHHNFRHGSAGKRVTLHDEVVRVPLLVWGAPVVRKGVVSTRPAMLSDVAPSILAAAGAPVPSSMTGTNLWPLWSTAAAAELPRGGSVIYGPRGWALRTASRKLIVEQLDGGREHVELYDLADDAGERRNLARSHPRAAAALRRRLAARLGAVGIPASANGSSLPQCPLCAWEEASAFWDLVDPTRLATRGGAAPAQIDAATRERLHALGYLDP